MVNITEYTEALVRLLKEAFGERLIYVGLQGSYLRGEATEESDVDAMVVLDDISAADLEAYRAVVERLPKGAAACGFVCGKADLRFWNPLEAYQLLHDTKDLCGALEPLLPPYTRRDLKTYAQLGVGNLYHELCHRYIYGGSRKSAERLPDAFRQTPYILRNLHAYRTGEWIRTNAGLLEALAGRDRRVMDIAVRARNGWSAVTDAGEADERFPEAFTLLLDWCKETLVSIADS